MSVTIRDVALAAGVSAMSVSKVLHGKGPNVRVSPATAELIRRVAQELDYRPNALARQFRKKRTNTLGLLFEDDPYFAATQYFAQVVDGVVQAAFPRGFGVTMCPTLLGGESKESLSDGRFDGFVWVCGGRSIERRLTIQDSDRPVVVIHEPPLIEEARPMTYVVCDNYQGVRVALEHLVRLGHRRIGLVTVLNRRVNRDVVAREIAFAELAERLELEVPAAPFEWTHECVEFDDWWAAGPRETALFAWADAQAIHILDRASKAGCRVPEDLSVVGFDSTLDCEKARPRLSSVHQPLVEMAADATRMLIEGIEAGSLEARQTIHPCWLDVRDSTAAPRKQDARP